MSKNSAAKKTSEADPAEATPAAQEAAATTDASRPLEEATSATATRQAAPGDRIELIETFARIVEAGGIGAAAKLLDTTQPTVSRRLRQLEILLDAKLIERGPQGMSLTPAGAALLPSAQEMLGRWRALEETAKSAEGPLFGRARIALACAFAARMASPTIAEFMRRNPKARVELRRVETAEALLVDGFDFAITGGKPAHEALASRPLGRVRLVLCASPERAAAVARRRGVGSARCEPLSLEAEPMILHGPAPATPVIFQGRDGASQSVTLEVAAAVDDLDAAMMLALEGAGVALLPQWRAEPFVAAGALVRLGDEWTSGEQGVSIAWAPTRLRGAAAAALFDALTSALPPLLTD